MSGRWSAFSRSRGVACAYGGDKLPRRGQADLFADGGEWLRVPGGRVDQLHRGLAARFLQGGGEASHFIWTFLFFAVEFLSFLKVKL